MISEEDVESTTLDYSIYEYYDLEDENEGSIQLQPTTASPTSHLEAILNGKNIAVRFYPFQGN